MNDAEDTPIASKLYHEGRRAMDAGDTASAIDQLLQCLNVFPHFKTAELLGECLLKVGRLNEAIIYLACSAGLGRNQSRSRYLLAKALLEHNDPHQAMIKLHEALTINPQYKKARELSEELRKKNPGIEEWLGLNVDDE